MDFSKDQKKEAYRTLDESQKDFVSSEEYTQTLQAIGEKHGFLLDKTGLLSDIVFAALIGLIKIAQIESVLEDKLQLSGAELQELLKDINEKIFAPFRLSLIAQSEKQIIKPIENSPVINIGASEPTRDSILAEIENPTPSVHPITVANAPVSGPAMTREIVTETKETVAHDFIGSKLTETVALPSQKASVTLKAPEVKPKSYSADPYREAIN